MGVSPCGISLLRGRFERCEGVCGLYSAPVYSLVFRWEGKLLRVVLCEACLEKACNGFLPVTGREVQ